MEASARGELRAKMARRISLGKREGKAMRTGWDGKEKRKEEERRRRREFEVSRSTLLFSPSSPGGLIPQ